MPAGGTGPHLASIAGATLGRFGPDYPRDISASAFGSLTPVRQVAIGPAT
jgi:hypothetical protein